MSYVDGFLLPVPTKNLKEYKKIAAKAGKIWKEHGALDFKECVGEDLNVKGMTSFKKVAKTKPRETVVFSYIVFRSRKHRDAVNKKVMADPRLEQICPAFGDKEMPFDVKRMAYGGFKVIVDPK
jgi:uncharacterized protein YbaA (DUF1428 family)